MKKYFLLFSVLIISLSACKKTDVTTQANVDDEKIQAYIKANNVTGLTKDPSGVYYKIVKPGTGPYPVSTSTVKVSYSGTYLNGQPFAGGASLTNVVTGFVTGFQTGIVHINAGGRIYMIVPSTLAYGPNPSSDLGFPDNAVLIFTADLQGFY
jgi:FKBP-type peptidyl-prolyl cis-trans isomerase FkpA